MQPSYQSDEDLLFQRAHELRVSNINPYSHQFAPTHTLIELFDQFGELKIGEDWGVEEIRVYGRITSIVCSIDTVEIGIEDQRFAITLVAREDTLDPESMARLRTSVYCGDILGFVVDTIEAVNQTLLVYVRSWQYLALANLPVPRHIVVERQREARHLHWASGLSAREVVEQRSTIITQTRRFMSAADFLEVVLPSPVTEGGEASSSERQYKVAQLLVGGIERFYEIGHPMNLPARNWQHHPQALILRGTHTLVSLEQSMQLIENLIGRLAIHLHTADVIPWQPFDVLSAGSIARLKPVFEEDHTLEIDLSPNWPRRTTRQLMMDVCNLDFSPDMSLNDALTKAQAEALELEVSSRWTSGHDVMMAVFYQIVAPFVIQPTFVVHPPHEGGGNERCELFLNGILFAQGQAEVTDPEAFNMTNEVNEAGLHLRMFGMPPAVSFEVHLDRLAMLLLNKPDIRDVLI